MGQRAVDLIVKQLVYGERDAIEDATCSMWGTWLEEHDTYVSRSARVTSDLVRTAIQSVVGIARAPPA